MAMYHCFGCDRWIDNDHDPMDNDGECGMCQEDKEEEKFKKAAEGRQKPQVILTTGGVTYAYQTPAHARQGLLESPLYWCMMAVEDGTNKVLKERGQIVGPLPTFH